MKSFLLALYATIGLGLSQGRELLAQSEATHIMLDLSRAAVRSETTIRVKVFPHERDYPPHGTDTVRDELMIEAEKPCSLFAAPADRIVAQG